jgi:hypothetical protein
MSVRSVLRARLAVLAAAAVMATGWAASAGPAGAAGAWGGFTSPSGDAPLTTASPAVAGTANVTGCVSGIDLAIAPLDSQTAPGTNPHVQLSGNGRSSQSFTWPAPAPVLPENGHYLATATVHYRPIGAIGCLGQESTVTLQQPFSLAVPPAPPAHVAAAPAGTGRDVAVTWDPPSEPDLVGHLVTRAPGSSPCPDVPPPGASTVGTDQASFTDTPPPADGAASFCYWVQAVRRGATTDKTVTSSASRPATAALAPAAVAAPPAGPTPTPAASPAPPESASPAPSQIADVAAQQAASKEFATLVNRAARAAPATTTPTDPDTGFTRTLPFHATATAAGDVSNGAGAAVSVAAPVDAGSDHSDLTALAAVAGGLVVLVVAGLLLLLRREVYRSEKAGSLDAG